MRAKGGRRPVRLDLETKPAPLVRTAISLERAKWPSEAELVLEAFGDSRLASAEVHAQGLARETLRSDHGAQFALALLAGLSAAGFLKPLEDILSLEAERQEAAEGKKSKGR
jgi:hypothetical protein